MCPGVAGQAKGVAHPGRGLFLRWGREVWEGAATGPRELAEHTQSLCRPDKGATGPRDQVSLDSTQKPGSVRATEREGPGGSPASGTHQTIPSPHPRGPGMGEASWSGHISQTLPPHWEGSVPRAWPGQSKPQLAQQEAEKV